MGMSFTLAAGAERARDALADFGGGAVVVGVLGPFFKCPGAPNETALLVHDYLSRRGLRESSTIHLVSPMPMPIPISKRTSSAIVAILEEHEIEYWPSSRVTRLDPEHHVAHLDDGRQLPYDLFLGIPVHCAPEVVVASDLAEDGWVPVDPATFATKFPGVFAVGDVTSAPVPRAGGIAEGEAATVAKVLISQLTGGSAPLPYDGASACYVELGDDLVGRIDVDFLSYDTPVAKFRAPTAALNEEKRQWGVHASRSVVRTGALPGHIRRLKRATWPRRATETLPMWASGVPQYAGSGYSMENGSACHSVLAWFAGRCEDESRVSRDVGLGPHSRGSGLVQRCEARCFRPLGALLRSGLGAQGAGHSGAARPTRAETDAAREPLRRVVPQHDADRSELHPASSLGGVWGRFPV